MLCEAYRDVAETALSHIPTDNDGSTLTGPGDFVRAAADLVALTEEVMRRAVIYERERGSSWEAIGDTLGITKQSAHKRFAGAVEAWRAPFDQPAARLSDGTPNDDRIPYGARYAAGAPNPEHGTAEYQAQRLEQWLLQHTGPTDHWHGDEHPVTGHLPRHTTMSMLVLSHRLLQTSWCDPQAQADVAERRVALYERLIREGDAPPQATTWIAEDRARATALRVTPGNGVPWQAMTDPDRSANTAEQATEAP